MSIVALDGTPLVVIGAPFVQGSGQALPGAQSTLQDATNEACIMYGNVITDDGGSHTLNTSGSSALSWMTGSVTFANAGTTFVVGLATMDTTTGPPGRATNSTDVITPSASKTMTGGGGGVTTGAWQTHVPDTGSLAVANGDFIAFFTQMTARGGVDVVNTVTGTISSALPRPGVTNYTGGSYAALAGVPNVLITFSDGHLGWFYGGAVFQTSSTSQPWNSGSATKEYGNYFLMPFPAKIYGLTAGCSVAGDTDFILYSDPLGTPVAEKTVSADANAKGQSVALISQYLFASPYSASANQPLAGIIKPTTVTNIAATYKTYNASASQVTEMCGTNAYAVNRASGAFAAQNSNKDRFAIGLLVGAFDAGGSTGISRARAASGF